MTEETKERKTIKCYITRDGVFEVVGRNENVLRCIASHKKTTLDTFIFNINTQNARRADFTPYTSKEQALNAFKEEAYWENKEIFLREE